MSLNIALYQPEIPLNTGSIGRSCVLTDTKLHLIKPLGFSIEDKMLKRAGLDYWKHLDVTYYENFEEFYNINKNNKIYLATTKADKYYSNVEFKDGDFILFGRESSGVPNEINQLFKNTQIKVPMIKSTDRSLNISNTASIILYEALRQIGYPNMK